MQCCGQIPDDSFEKFKKNDFKKNDSENVSPPKSTILNVDFVLKLRVYRSLKSLYVSKESLRICLQHCILIIYLYNYLRMNKYCTRTVQELYKNCTRTVQELYKNCTRTVQEL